MKKIALLILVMVFSGFAIESYGITAPVTFQVDMSNQMVSANGVHLAGSFDLPWDPAGYELLEEGNGVYAITLNLSVGSTYMYKFINGNDWPFAENVPGDCSVDGNRSIEVMGATVIDPVCFGACGDCEPTSMVTFTVNMKNQVVENGVFIAGSFQGWNPGGTQMTLGEDAYYSVSVFIPIGHDVFYKFVNGGQWGGDESVPGCCNQDGNRYLFVSDEDIVVDPVCFGECYDCTEETTNITFQVDMSSQAEVFDVHLAGNFPDNWWNATAITLTDMGNNVYATTIEIPVGYCLEYKFVNGDSGWEDVSGDCVTGWSGNRYIEATANNQILDPVCFNSCDACEGFPGTAADLFFSEYYEGSFGNNKYVEIYNGTGAAVDLSNYRTHRISNGGEWDEFIYPLEGILEDGGLWVIANSQSMPEILEHADETSALCYFNGDDAVGLAKNVDGEWQMIDAIGEDGPDPGSGWDVAGVSNATANHTLVRKASVCEPTMDWAVSSGTDADDSQWIVYPANTLDYIGFHNCDCGPGGGGTPTADAPTFSQPAGLVGAAFELTISCDTDGAIIYFTTDGSDPDFNSAMYETPINITEATTVKAIAYAVGFVSSDISEISYQFPDVVVATLAELREAMNAKADYYQVSGEVILTFQQDFRGQKYIQDATAGVLIDDPSGNITTTYDRYDGITGMVGTLSEFGGMIQFTPAIDPGAASSAENVIVPQTISLNELFSNFDAYESELVKLVDIQFEDAGSNFFNGSVYPINNDAKAMGNFRSTFYDVDYIGTAIPEGHCAIIGIPNSRNEGEFITSRDLNDIITYTYPMGWMGISSNVIPEGSPMMEDIFADIEENIVILVGTDGIYWPGQNINSIGAFDTYKGYKIKFGEETSFEFTGTAPDDRTVTLGPGIAYIPVLSQEAVSVDNIIVPLGDAVEFVYDIRFGTIYWPTGGIVPGMGGALETLSPGFAYLARFNEAATLDFSSKLPKAVATTSSSQIINNTFWNDVAATGDQHIISISESALASLKADDVVGAFNTHNLCVGMASYNGSQNALPLVVYGNDMTTQNTDGMNTGEALSFKVFRNGEELNVTAGYDMSIQNNDGLFAENGLSIITDLKAGATGMSDLNEVYSIYPNPGNGLFNVNVSGTFDVMITNAQGQLVSKMQIIGNSVIDLSKQPEGLYFIRFTNKTSTMIEKVIIR